MTEIDHRAEAERLLRVAESEATNSADYAAIARGYTALASAPVRPSVEAMRRAVEGAELAGRYDELRDAVREFIAGEFDPDHLDLRLHRLRDLIGRA